MLVENLLGVDFRAQYDPLLDDFYVTQLKNDVAFALANKLIRRPVDVDAWVDRRYAAAALRELRVASYWPARKPPALRA